MYGPHQDCAGLADSDVNRHSCDLQALAKSQRAYRNALDNGYQPVRDLIAIIGEKDALITFQPRLDELLASVAGQADKTAAMTIKDFEVEMKSVAGISPVKSLISKARRALDKDNTQEGRALLEEAATLMATEIAWRNTAEKSVLDGLIAYHDAGALTIGLRSQSRLPDEIVPRISSYKALHRDISLRF